MDANQRMLIERECERLVTRYWNIYAGHRTAKLGSNRAHASTQTNGDTT